MISSNLHTHSTFSDGKHTPEEMILQAKELSFVSIGFSDHSEKMIPHSFWKSRENIEAYKKEIRELSQKYEEEIQVFCGIEMDAFAQIDTEPFDYSIGSVHFIKAFDEIVPIDLALNDQLAFIEKHGRGDKMELARRYFDQLVTFGQKSAFDILGHFDLINKFSLFDEEDPLYQKLAREALDELVKCVPFIEVNTGAISRGYRNTPYPASFLFPVLKEKNAKLVLSSDAHRKEWLDCFFDQIPSILSEAGITSLWQKNNVSFEEIPLDINDK